MSATPHASQLASTAVAALASVGEAVVATDAGGVVTYWNSAAERMFGYAASEAVGRPAAGLAVTEPSEEQVHAIRLALREGRTWSGQFRCRRKDGTVFPVQVTDTPLVDPDGRLVGIVGVIRDLSGEQLHRGIVEAADEGIIKVQDGLITFCNAAAARMFGFPEGSVVGRVLREFFDADQVLLLDDARSRLQSGESVRTNLRLRRPDGSERWLAVSARSLRDESARHDGTVALLTDITERRALELETAYRASHDELTGLVNRAEVTSRLASRIAGWPTLRRPELAVLFCDLDRFKDVNDSCGHDAGDLLLRLVAERLVGAVRATDTVARFGADEFVIVCDGVDGPDGARTVARRILDVLSRPFTVEDRQVAVTASMGIALAGEACSPQRLLADAGSALYEAKRLGGGGRVCLFDDSLRHRATTRLRLHSDIRGGLDGGEFVCLYQPIVDLTTARVAGFEALLRWQHPERGLLSPESFLEVAEESGLIISLGEWALKRACDDLGVLGSALGRSVHVAVNVSARQFNEKAFADRIALTVASSGVDPNQLVLEVTETTLMEDAGAAVEVMTALRRWGVRFAIDDFGTGYSSLLYLRQFPIDELKIDRCFVGGLGSSTDDSAIVASVVSLSKAMSRICVAEGVETFDQLALLRELGCDYAQGYLFSAPVPLSEAVPTVVRIENALSLWDAAEPAGLTSLAARRSAVRRAGDECGQSEERERRLRPLA